MVPLLAFATGIVAGILGVKVLKNAKAPAVLRTGAANGLDRARQVTVSSLSAIERSSANLREKLAVPPASAPEAAATADGAEQTAAPSPESAPESAAKQTAPQTVPQTDATDPAKADKS